MRFVLIVVLLSLLHDTAIAQADRKNAPSYQEGYVDVGNGVKLFFQKLGDGSTKVIVPLGLYLYEGLKSLAEDDDRTILFYDVRNRGRSSHIRDSALIGIWQDVDDLERLRKHFSFEKTSLIGWSYLGMMVMLYTSKHEKNVERVIQLGPVALKWDTKFPAEYTNAGPSLIDSNETKKIDRLIKEDYHRREPRKFTEEWFAANAPDLLGDASNIKKVLALGPQVASNENEWYTNFRWHLYHHFFGSVQKLNADSLWPAMKNIQVPVLTIHGTKDRNAAYGAGRQWATELPNARLLTVEGAGHVPWIENKELVISGIDVFLDGKWPDKAIKLK
jgi:pimeloyl-ACP methyl ester carboxylesterase